MKTDNGHAVQAKSHWHVENRVNVDALAWLIKFVSHEIINGAVQVSQGTIDRGGILRLSLCRFDSEEFRILLVRGEELFGFTPLRRDGRINRF